MGATGPLGELNYNNGYLRVNNGTICLTANDGSNADRGINIDAGGATLEALGGVAWTFGAGANTLYGTGPLTLAGAGSGAINTAVTTSGPLNMNGSGTWILAGANTYAGGTKVASGVLQIGNSAALGSGALAANGGTLDLAGYSVTVPSFSGAVGTITNSAGGGLAAFTVNQAVNTTFNGAINDGAGQVALVKSAAGTLVLSGTSNYSGGTTLSNGTLVATNPASLGTSSGAPHDQLGHAGSRQRLRRAAEHRPDQRRCHGPGRCGADLHELRHDLGHGRPGPDRPGNVPARGFRQFRRPRQHHRR